MDGYWCLWILMDGHWYLWRPMDANGWMIMDRHWCLWRPVGVRRYQWIGIGAYGGLWLCEC